MAEEKIQSESARLLVVDDDKDIRDLLAGYLRQHSLSVDTAESGQAMFRLLENNAYDLLILDIMIPGDDGLQLYRKLRASQVASSAVPVIFLTALGEPTDRVVGLELGADDYVVKPFQPRELLARIRAVLRRAGLSAHNGSSEKSYGFDGWVLDLSARHLVDPDKTVVNLSGAEFRLLKVFLEHPQQVLSRDFLQEQTRGHEPGPFDRSLDVQIFRLRGRLRDNGREARLIKTVRGDGYVFTSQVSVE